VVSNTFRLDRLVGVESSPASQAPDTSSTVTSVPRFDRLAVQAALAGNSVTAGGAWTSGGLSGGISADGGISAEKREALAALRNYLQVNDSSATVSLPPSIFAQLFPDSIA
jgi:hypothetical protein